MPSTHKASAHAMVAPWLESSKVTSAARRSAAVRLAVLAAAACLAGCGVTGFAVQVQPRTDRPARSPPAVRGQDAEADLIASAVSAAVYKMWSREYPMAAAAGHFQGWKASQDDVAARMQLLQDALQLTWTEVLGLVKADSTVLFAGPAREVTSAFKQLIEELGSREAALDVLRMQPALLSVHAMNIEGKGHMLQHLSKFSHATRPLYRAYRQLSLPGVAAPLPKPLELSFLGLH